MSPSTTSVLPGGAACCTVYTNAIISSIRDWKNSHGGETNTTQGIVFGNSGIRFVQSSTSPGRTSNRSSMSSSLAERPIRSAVGK